MGVMGVMGLLGYGVTGYWVMGLWGLLGNPWRPLPEDTGGVLRDTEGNHIFQYFHAPGGVAVLGRPHIEDGLRFRGLASVATTWRGEKAW